MLWSCSETTEEEVVFERPRTIITTDGEVDDIDSFVRVLLYANEMDIQAIVYSSSQWHWKGDGKGTLLTPQNRVPGDNNQMFGRSNEPRESVRWIGNTWVQELIEEYGKCWPNLLKHDSRYPSPDYLKSIIKMGNVSVEGDMAEPTEGSDYIKDMLLDDVPGLLHAQIWGGTNTVARALLSIEEQYKGTAEWDAIYRKVSDKLVLNIIQDQDGTWRTYVSKNWPEVRTIMNGFQFMSFAYMWRQTVPQAYHKYLDGDWFNTNILNDHGPLTAKYLGLGSGYQINDPGDRFWDPAMVERMPGAKLNDFISEGDSPSYFVLFDFFGLRSVEHPEWGTFGGRYNMDANGRVWSDPEREGGFGMMMGGPDQQQQSQEEKPKVTFDRVKGDYNPYTGEVDMFYSQTRWVEALQNDFAARADWCVKDFADANHAPVVKVKGKLDLTAAPGETVKLTGSSTDPDGDAVILKWWQYREAGTCDAVLDIQGADTAEASVVIPANAPSGSTLHIMLQGFDNGTPQLTRLQRVIITVK